MNPPRLEKRNVQLFDSEGAVIAGTSISLIIYRFLLTASRILAIWHFAVGRVLQILDRIPCYFNNRLDNLQIRPRTAAATWTAVSVRASDCATRILCPALQQWVALLLRVSLKLTNSQPAGDPIRVGLVPTLPRPRHPTISKTPARVAVPL